MIQHTELIASLRAESDELIKYQFSHTKEAMSCLQRLHDLSLEAADALQALEPDDSGIVPDSDKVICPGCSHQFTAIPGNVQARLQALERVPMTWQSIDTAPKDGTNVLLYFSGLGWVRGSWDSQIHHRKPIPYWTHDCIQYMGVAHARANQPNWWKPLPPTPPESKG